MFQTSGEIEVSHLLSWLCVSLTGTAVLVKELLD